MISEGLLQSPDCLILGISAGGVLERILRSALGPWLQLLLFLASSFIIIWRLECMTERGMEGTVLGTLIMPYCSGVGNLIFVLVLGRTNGPGKEVLTNCLVNNVTNLTLLIGIPAIFWGMAVIPAGKVKKTAAKTYRINRLSLLLTTVAVFFFTGILWALARDGVLNFGDGLVLIGVFLFWQCFHVCDVLKNNVVKNRGFQWVLLIDLALLAVGTWGLYISVEWLVEWLSKIETGFISRDHMGWLSGWLMVLPNALLALYYGWRNRPDIVYSSQMGDGHICIPLCIGIFCLFSNIRVPAFFDTGIAIILGAAAIHFLFIAAIGRLPRWVGWILLVTYTGFVYLGLVE